MSFDIFLGLKGVAMSTEKCFFEFLHCRVETEDNFESGKELPAEATVRIKIGEEIEHRVAEGNGPINALDAAMRKALEPHFPCLKNVQLIDFWVRIHNGSAGTAASVDVLIDFCDGEREWVKKANSTNIITASALSLMEGFREAISASQEKLASAVN